MSDKYASLSPYVYCADNPVKLVDPNGEEITEDKPPRGLFKLLSNLENKVYGTAENRQFEGGADGANQGTMTKQDVDVAITVGATMLSVGTALEAETALDATVAIVSTVNNIDDATVNSSDQTVSQRVTANSPNANKAVNGAKTLVSLGSGAYSGYKVGETVKKVIKDGTQVIKKEAKTIAANVGSAASSAYSLVKSFFSTKKHNDKK